MKNMYLFDEHVKNLVINMSLKHDQDKGTKVKLQK